jgi:hypothetical protein
VSRRPRGEFATLNPSTPKDLPHFGHGIWSKLKNAATTTIKITTAQTNLTTKLLVAMHTNAPDTRRKATARLEYWRLRRLRRPRIVIWRDYQSSNIPSAKIRISALRFYNGGMRDSLR